MSHLRGLYCGLELVDIDLLFVFPFVSTWGPEIVVFAALLVIIKALAFGIVLLSQSQSRNELFLNTQDFQVPVCPLCNKPVPVPRGEQPDIKVCIACGNITSKMLKLKEFGIYWSFQCVIFSLVSLHHSLIFFFFFFLV